MRSKQRKLFYFVGFTVIFYFIRIFIEYVHCKKFIYDNFNLIIPQIDSKRVKSFHSAKHVITKNAGQIVHFEKQGEFVNITNNFLTEF